MCTQIAIMLCYGVRSSGLIYSHLQNRAAHSRWRTLRQKYGTYSMHNIDMLLYQHEDASFLTVVKLLLESTHVTTTSTSKNFQRCVQRGMHKRITWSYVADLSRSICDFVDELAGVRSSYRNFRLQFGRGCKKFASWKPSCAAAAAARLRPRRRLSAPYRLRGFVTLHAPLF